MSGEQQRGSADDFVVDITRRPRLPPRPHKTSLLAVVLIVLCASPFVVFMAYEMALNEMNKEKTTTKPAVEVYAANADIVCATDRHFLDSSPLVSPANFARVNKGTQFFIVDIGGVASGKMYYGLSAGGRERIYVYRNAFDDKFTKVRTLEK